MIRSSIIILFLLSEPDDEPGTLEPIELSKLENKSAIYYIHR